MADVYGSARPRRRWGRRLLVTLIVLLIIVGGILVVADRLGVSFAEREVATRVAQQVADQGASSAEPEVTIEGIPFLTQVLDGKYQEIKILLRDFAGPAGQNRTIKMPLLDVRAKDVRADLNTIRTGQGQVTATSVTGTGTVGYDNLSALVGKEGVQLSEKDGKLLVTAPLTVAGQKTEVTGTANLTVAGNKVQMRFEQVTAPGLPNVPFIKNLLNSYARQISVDLEVPALPLGLKVTKVQPTPAGLVVDAGAGEVALTNGG